MKTRLLVVGFVALTLCGADVASGFVSANTIDGHATYTRDGTGVRATGPIGCTSGDQVSIRVTVTQSATGARARETWKRHCTGELQHWQVRASARRGSRFQAGSGRVCAVAKRRRASRVTDTRRWCEPVLVSTGLGEPPAPAAQPSGA